MADARSADAPPGASIGALRSPQPEQSLPPFAITSDCRPLGLMAPSNRPRFPDRKAADATPGNRPRRRRGTSPQASADAPSAVYEPASFRKKGNVCTSWRRVGYGTSPIRPMQPTARKSENQSQVWTKSAYLSYPRNRRLHLRTCTAGREHRCPRSIQVNGRSNSRRRPRLAVCEIEQDHKAYMTGAASDIVHANVRPSLTLGT